MGDKMKITKDMTIGEVMRDYPETAEVLMKNGLRCIGCVMAMMETLEQGTKSHGINLEKLLKELNETIETEKKE